MSHFCGCSVHSCPEVWVNWSCVTRGGGWGRGGDRGQGERQLKSARCDCCSSAGAAGAAAGAATHYAVAGPADGGLNSAGSSSMVYSSTCQGRTASAGPPPGHRRGIDGATPLPASQRPKKLQKSPISVAASFSSGVNAAVLLRLHWRSLEVTGGHCTMC